MSATLLGAPSSSVKPIAPPTATAVVGAQRPSVLGCLGWATTAVRIACAWLGLSRRPVGLAATLRRQAAGQGFGFACIPDGRCGDLAALFIRDDRRVAVLDHHCLGWSPHDVQALLHELDAHEGWFLRADGAVGGALHRPIQALPWLDHPKVMASHG